MNHIYWIPREIAVKYYPDKMDDYEVDGLWATQELNPDDWEAMVSEAKELKSEAVKSMIDRTTNKELEWSFAWCWFTGGFYFPIFVAKDGEVEYRAQVSPTIKEWGYIIVITGSDGYFYDSAMDDENHPVFGMELWYLIEKTCTNYEYFQDELRKRDEARKEGKDYPEVIYKETPNED